MFFNLFRRIAAWLALGMATTFSGNSVAQECLPTIPYGYFSGYLSLPRSSSFCVQKGLKNIAYETDPYGGRVIGSGKLRTNVFGESQALVIDSKELPILYQKLGINKAHIYATPNNGPYEWLRRLAQGNYVAAESHLYVVNLGFDIFRLGSNWSAKDLAGTELTTVEKFINWPRLLSLRLMWGQYQLRRFALDGDDRAYKLQLFLSDSPGYEEKLRVWAETARPILAERASDSNAHLIVVTPYWIEAADPSQTGIARRLLRIVTCSLGSAVKVTGVSFRYDPTSVTEDGRHFRHTAEPHLYVGHECND
jgi:hypothetical protein